MLTRIHPWIYFYVHAYVSPLRIQIIKQVLRKSSESFFLKCFIIFLCSIGNTFSSLLISKSLKIFRKLFYLIFFFLKLQYSWWYHHLITIFITFYCLLLPHITISHCFSKCGPQITYITKRLVKMLVLGPYPRSTKADFWSVSQELAFQTCSSDDFYIYHVDSMYLSIWLCLCNLCISSCYLSV